MTGTVTISLEIELGWGYHDLASFDTTGFFSPNGERERATLRRILAVCESAGIEVTFDVVGHLLLEHCRGHGETPHAEGWFDADPESGVETDPLFYAPDILEEIVSSPVAHEVATHTFSHVLLDEASDAVIDWELDQVRSVHRNHEIAPPSSIVAPRHRRPRYDVLGRHGLERIRVRLPPRRSMYRYGWAHERWHPTRRPREVDGLFECYTTHSLSSPLLKEGQTEADSLTNAIPERIRERMHRRYLFQGVAAAVGRDSYAHYWSHLGTIANDQQWPPVEAFLHRLGELSDAGQVNVQTMRDIAR